MILDLADLSPPRLKRYLRVKNMPSSELMKITAKWERGTYFDVHLRMNQDTHEVVEINLLRIIERAEFLGLDTDTLITDDDLDFRYVEIIERWEKGLFIDPPSVSFEQDNIGFYDGRHRTVAAYHIGETSIPVAVFKEDIEQARALM